MLIFSQSQNKTKIGAAKDTFDDIKQTTSFKSFLFKITTQILQPITKQQTITKDTCADNERHAFYGHNLMLIKFSQKWMQKLKCEHCILLLQTKPLIFSTDLSCLYFESMIASLFGLQKSIYHSNLNKI